jgi:hypothetical protein
MMAFRMSDIFCEKIGNKQSTDEQYGKSGNQEAAMRAQPEHWHSAAQ